MKTAVLYIDNDSIRFIVSSEKEGATIKINSQWLYFFKKTCYTPDVDVYSGQDLKALYYKETTKYHENRSNGYVGNIFRNLDLDKTFEDASGQTRSYSDFIGDILVPVLQKRIEKFIDNKYKIPVYLVYSINISEKSQQCFERNLSSDIFFIVGRSKLRNIAFSLMNCNNYNVSKGVLFINMLDDYLESAFLLDDGSVFISKNNEGFIHHLETEFNRFVLSKSTRKFKEEDLVQLKRDNVFQNTLFCFNTSESNPIKVEFNYADGSKGVSLFSYRDVYEYCINVNLVEYDFLFSSQNLAVRMPLVVNLNDGRGDLGLSVLLGSLSPKHDLKNAEVKKYTLKDLLFSVIKDDLSIEVLRDDVEQEDSLSLDIFSIKLRQAYCMRNFHVYTATGQTQEAQNAFKEYEKWSNMLKS